MKVCALKYVLVATTFVNAMQMPDEKREKYLTDINTWRSRKADGILSYDMEYCRPKMDDWRNKMEAPDEYMLDHDTCTFALEEKKRRKS